MPTSHLITASVQVDSVITQTFSNMKNSSWDYWSKKTKQILRRVSSAIPFLAPGLTCQKRWRLNDKVTKHINPGVKHQLTLTHRCNYTWVTMPHCSVMKKKKFLKGPRTDCISEVHPRVNDVLGLTFYLQISGLCCFSTENQFKNTIGRKINYLVAL